MVPVKKADGSVRITVDYKALNKAVKREVFPIPTLEQLTSQIHGATLFSKLDAASGFFQLPLSEESSKLTTFITPLGRKAFLRLPMGISLAPECFQRKMEELLHDLPGVISYMDDIVCFGDEKTHDARLKAVLQRISESGLKLNMRKCAFRQPVVRFLGMRLSQDGLQVDQFKIEAIQALSAPTSVTELRSLLGMINHLCRFIPHVQSKLKPMYDLLKKETAWTWSHPQQQALQEVKHLISNAPVLAFFDPTKETVVSADASSFGIGGCILQRHGQQLKPVAFCSRTLSDSESRWAQIEKELLSAAWTCQKFHMFLAGLPNFKLEVDHKPLIPLINTKDLTQAPLRCQRMLMRMMQYNATAVYVPGKQHVIPDYLSRHPLAATTDEISSGMQAELHLHCDSVVQNLPATPKRLVEIGTAQQEDSILKRVAHQILHGWHESAAKDVDLAPFYAEQGQLSVLQMTFGPLIMFGQRLVIPVKLQKDILSKLHDDGHFGINKCRERASSSVWWPSMSKELKEYLKSCNFCQTNAPAQHREPLMPSAVPSAPWSHVATDIFFHNSKAWLVTVDILSRYLEIQELPHTTSSVVIGRLKALFSRYGIPDMLSSDGGTQFTSREFKDFTVAYGFTHRLSDPHMPSTNGAAERAVRTAKWILKQRDPLLALLNYRATPIDATGLSPAFLLMGRELQTRLPRVTADRRRSTLGKDASTDTTDNSFQGKNWKRKYAKQEAAQRRDEVKKQGPISPMP